MDYDFGKKAEVSEETAGEIIENVKALGECIGSASGGYGLTIENDAVMWKVSGWGLDGTSVWGAEGYGMTMEEAWKNYVDENETEELAAKWDERQKLLKG